MSGLGSVQNFKHRESALAVGCELCIWVLNSHIL